MLKVEERVEEGGSACVSACEVVVVVVDQRQVVLSLEHAPLHVERSTDKYYLVFCFCITVTHN